MPSVYQERVQTQATADAKKTITSQKVPVGHVIEISMMSASGNAGASGEYTQIGRFDGTTYCPFDSKVLDDVLETCFNRGHFFLIAGQRCYATFEAANTGENLVLCLNGVMYTEEEFAHKHGVANNAKTL